MSKTDRLLFILNLIRSNRNLKAKDLAEECEVSERTIYRDINAISSAHVPIYFENGYKFLTNAFLPPLNFSLDEYLALSLGLNSEIINSNPALKSSERSALAKLESIIPENVKEDYHKMKEKIDIEFRPKNQDLKQSLLFDLLKQALLKDTKIKLELLSKKSTKTVKDVSIEKLFYKDSRWFVIATIEGKKKTIAINQIRSVSL
jgi:predicted DNA-binding transcriptional regulator YafY